MAPRRMTVATPYGLSFSVTCMALEEILAEKVRATLMRRAPRDYFDLWLLLQHRELDFAAVPHLLQAKLETVNRPYEPEGLWAQPDVLQRVWNDDLRQLMRDVPAFEIMFHELRTLFKEQLPETLYG